MYDSLVVVSKLTCCHVFMITSSIGSPDHLVPFVRELVYALASYTCEGNFCNKFNT